MAMSLLLGCPHSDRRARVCGDSLAVFRHCASQGRLRRPAMQAVLEPALARVCTGAWRVTWRAIRRRLNMAADACAAEGVFWAWRLMDETVTERRLRVRWLAAPARSREG